MSTAVQRIEANLDAISQGIDAIIAERDRLRALNAEMLEALEYAWETITRPADIDIPYRLLTLNKVKAAIRGYKGEL